MQACEYRMGDIGMIKGGACLVAQSRRRVVVDVVDHRGISRGLGVYRRADGGENSKYIESKSITGQQAELDVF